MSNFFLESVDSNDITDTQNMKSMQDTLNDTNDLTRLAYQNKSGDIPIRNNSMIDRFESDTFINHKESFESNNSRLNGLHDEIRELKEKLRIIPEKEDKIHELKCENDNLRLELEEIKISYQKCKQDTISLSSDKKFLQNKIDRLLKENEDKKEIISNSEEQDKEKEDLIPIDILQIKQILCSRLKMYHEKHIDELIKSYQLHNKKEIPKELMEKILIEAIHI
tara:strand:- start:479 stop:1147 length:669 start_codon:yes stop_codon:yes gene_type:complete